MAELPLADTTPLRVTGVLFKDLVFAFEPQDIPDGAMILRTLKRNGAIIMDEVEDASLVLIDTELPGAPDLLRQAAGKVVLHYSWVNKSMNAGNPLLESSSWGDCRVTPENISQDFGYVPPPPSSNPQLQTPRPTPEERPYSFSAPSRFSQSLGSIAPPSSQPPYTPTPSQWSLESTMLQQQTPQLPPTNQVVHYNSQPMQQPSMFSPFPMSQPTDRSEMTFGQQQAWPPFHPGPYGMMQPPTMEDVRRAYEVMMMMWFQRPPMHQQLPQPPIPTQQNPTFHPPPPPPTQNSQNASSTRLEAPTVPGTAFSTTMSRQNSINSNDLGDLLGGPSPETSAFPVPSLLQTDPVPPLLLPDNTAGPSMAPIPLHTHRKLFEHDIGKPIMFCVPIILKSRGKIAEIFRATGGGFTDDVEDADYVVLGQWEEHYFDEMWYSARDSNKPTVTPAFVIDSYEKGRLMDPNGYPTRGPEKPRKDEPRKVRSRPATGSRKRKGRGRGRGGATFVSAPPTPSGEAPKWLRFYKEAEHTKSLQYIGAMFKKNAELTHDALAIHLHNKMSNHTINSWKKYCLYYTDAIEDLRKRAINNAEKRAIPKDVDMTDASGTEAAGATLFIPPGDIPQQANPEQTNPQQPGPEQDIPQATIPQQPTSQPTNSQQATPQPAILQQSIPQPTVPQRVTPQSAIPQQVTPQPTIPQQETTQSVVPQQAISPYGSRPPPPPYEKVAASEPAPVKMEPLDEDQFDFAFATEVLSGWKPNEESDVALWKRMETMRTSATASSWEAFCEKHWSRFEHFFASRPAQT